MGKHSAKQSRFQANLLSNADLTALAAKAKLGDKDAQDRAVRALTGLVLKVASDFVRKAPSTGVHYDDLVSEGLLAVSIYFPRYDAARGGTVANYLVPCIQGMIQTHARQYLSPCGARVTRRAAAKLAEGREEGPAFRCVTQVDRRDSREHDDATRSSQIEDPHVEQPGTSMEELEDRQAIPTRLRAALAGLDDEQREALVRRFGVGRQDPQNFLSIAKELGTSEDFARVLFYRAVKELGIKSAKPGPVGRARIIPMFPMRNENSVAS